MKIAGCLVAVALIISACTPDPHELVVSEAGEIPIILTAPHGGDQQVPNIDELVAQINDTDEYTYELTMNLIHEIERITGRWPYVVAARFERKYIDANRPEAEAFQDPDARPYYQAYHVALKHSIDEVRRLYPDGALLIDIHSQSKDGFQNKVCRGTRNGQTVIRLVNRHGEEALKGPLSIASKLEANRYEVFPPEDGIEEPCYNGGHTVATYGSHRDDGIDAIQLEIGTELLSDEEKRTEFTADLAEAISVFWTAYLR